MAGTVFDLGYRPRELQAVLHKSLKRFNVVVTHRRFGKTVFAIMEALHEALTNPLPDPRVALVYPTRQQGKAVAWDTLRKYASKIPGVVITESELRIDIPRKRIGADGKPERDENGDEVVDTARIQLFGSHDNQDQQLRGLYFDLVIFDEYGSQKPRTWSEIVRPALSDRKGRALFIGTPNGPDHFADLYNEAADLPDWFRAIYPASETGILSEDELADCRRSMDEAEYQQEYECSFSAAVRGAYYGEQLRAAHDEGRIGVVHWTPAVPVLVGMDIGVRDLTAAWFCQIVGTEIRLLEYDEWQNLALHEVLRFIRQKRFVIDRLILPHDVMQRDYSLGDKTRLSTIEGLGFDTQVVPYHNVADGIEVVRQLFPKMHFDAERCAQGLDRLELYQRKWNPELGRFMDKPVHDRSSDTADALRYLCMGLDELADGHEIRGDMIVQRRERAMKPRVLRSF